MFLFFAFLPPRKKGILIEGYRDIVSLATGYVIISLKIQPFLLVFGRFAVGAVAENETPKFTGPLSFSFPEAAILLVCARNRDLWPLPKPEVRDSRTHCQI